MSDLRERLDSSYPGLQDTLDKIRDENNWQEVLEQCKQYASLENMKGQSRVLVGSIKRLAEYFIEKHSQGEITIPEDQLELLQSYLVKITELYDSQLDSLKLTK